MLKTPVWLRDLQFRMRLWSARLPNRRFSAFDEQRIIDNYISELRIRDYTETAVDIGAGDGIRGSNTFHLFSNGWRGVGIEVDSSRFVRLARTYSSFAGVEADNTAITPYNVVDVLASHSVDREFGVLSLDIDGNDYWVLDALLAGYRPRLIVSEYNEKIPPPIKFVVEYDPAFKLRHHFFGYSIAKLAELLEKHDYVLLEIEYNNVFIAPTESAGAHSMTIGEAYNAGYRDRRDRRSKFPENENMELLHSLTPDEAVKFLKEFYREQAGRYQIGLK